METQDGYIVGVFNYCDRWCERCPLTARCRVFAAIARFDFEQDHGAMPAPEPEHRSLGAMALGQCGGDDDEHATAPPALLQVPHWDPPKLAPDAQALEDRVKALGFRLATWQPPEGTTVHEGISEALEVLGHYGIFIGAKVHRALFGLSLSDEGDGALSDASGSAKASLLAFDRLGDAWLKLVEHGAVSVAAAEPTLTELAWMTGEVERRFPQARAFVRPGLDEPVAVAMLEWQERG
ncbi:MAG: hypothetical protein IT179_09450 [Acidobacteria bacterium]|nr:hypothetical protein [Acidobacteriota bacterium]